MRVHDLGAPNERAHAFEVDNSRLQFGRTLSRILESVPGVTNVRLTTVLSGDEHRAYFEFQGVAFVVWEPFGDNSHYWIGPADLAVPAPDIGPLMQAFRDG